METSAEDKVVLANFINGEYVRPSGGEYLDSFDPSKGTVYAKIPDSSAVDVEAAVAAAKRAFPLWSASPREKRSALLLRVADILESRISEFARAESRDQGKTVCSASTVDIPRAVKNFRFFATHVLHVTDVASTIDGVALNVSQRWPIGVAGLISPWNLPLYLLTWKIAPCLAYGNCCVCKPSELTSVTAWMLCDVLKEAGLPNGVVNMVFGTGPRAGNALVVHPDVPMISFTGGTVTGAKISASCAPFFKKLSLELGGKNANIVFADCDYETALATSVRAAFANQGEICLCGSRVFVQSSIYDRFVNGFVQRTSELRVGDPSDTKTFVGALVSKEHLAKVMGYVKVAEEEGATIACGGGRMSVTDFEGGYFMQPTVVICVKPTSRIMQEEVFGPVVAICPFETEAEVVGYANGTPYGLSASVWTENGKRATRVAQQLQAGTVWVNCWLIRDLLMPFGGCKQSGIGREGGEYSHDFFTELKTICYSA